MRLSTRRIEKQPKVRAFRSKSSLRTISIESSSSVSLLLLTEYPCFGYNTMTGKEWWKICVLRSFTLAGVTTMGPRQAHDVFQRIYSVFGSQAAYERFDDARPFLHWAHRRGLVCGLLSNADERYGDSILPMLDLSMSSTGQQELQFQLFSKDYGLEKPDPKFFAAAVQRAAEAKQQETLHPSHVLHIGNDYTKDFEGARRAGMHAILLDRYHETERAKEWRRRGAVVLQDLMDVVEFLGQSQCKLGD